MTEPPKRSTTEPLAYASPNTPRRTRGRGVAVLSAGAGWTVGIGMMVVAFRRDWSFERFCLAYGALMFVAAVVAFYVGGREDKVLLPGVVIGLVLALLTPPVAVVGVCGLIALSNR